MAADKKTLNVDSLTYHNTNLLDQVKWQLQHLSPLVEVSDVNHFRKQLEKVFYGRAFVVQLGDCAERFSDAERSISLSKCNHLSQVKSHIENSLKVPVITVGRIAGQYAKPRSVPTELINGKLVYAYHGDMINGETISDLRMPDPYRLLKAYDSAKAVLSHMAEYDERFFTSHECFSLDYEHPLTRCENGLNYNLSTHFPWLGMRNLSSERHINYLSMIENPVALKIGPQAPIASMIDVIKRLNPQNVPGKIILVVRLGAANVSQSLPKFIHAVRENQLNVIWMSDPLHGNTQSDKYKRKFRLLSNAIDETIEVTEMLNHYGAHLGGVHLEASYKQNILECVSSLEELTENRTYDSALDPRMNPQQCEKYLDHVLEKISVQYA